jgi:hypothetical protein
MITKEMLEYQQAVLTNADEWVAACGGTETTLKGDDGREYLYCYNPFRHQHKYIRDDDIIVWDNMDLPRNLR